MKQSSCKWVKLEDYIEQCTNRNSDLIYGEEDAVGVNIDKEMGPMRAKIDPSKLRDFQIVEPNAFVFNQRGSRKLGISINLTTKTRITTYDHVVFKIKADCMSKLDPLFLFIYVSRKEFDRNAEYCAWGSSTEYFRWKNMCEVEIPLPPLVEQQKIVNAWKAFREIKEQNESIATPLMQMCQSYIQELKHEYESVELGNFIVEKNERNSDNKYGLIELGGVTSEGRFEETKAKTDGLEFNNYKIVNKEEFAYNPSRINLGSIALCEDDVHIISPMYVVFKVTDKHILMPEFLSIWFRRTEFQRSTLFYASGSVRDTFSFTEMRRVRIPLPPIEKQLAIVNIYNCANEAKRIAAEADRLSRELCPALIQHVIHE